MNDSIDEFAQSVADNLMSELPPRWGVYSVEVILRAGMIAQPRGTSATVRAVVGPTTHQVHEIAGVGEELSTALVDLHNKARARE